jgi:hypothetical protein
MRTSLFYTLAKSTKKRKNRANARLDELLTKIEQTLNDPYNFTYEVIDYFKNQVQQRGEEMIFKTQETMNQTMDKLDEYINECKKGLNKKCEVKSKKLKGKKNKGGRELSKWLATLNEVKIDEDEWKRIKIESEKAIEIFEHELVEFKIDLFPESFLDLRNKIENEFEIESPSGLL